MDTDTKKNLCAECREPIDPEGGDDSRYASVKEDYICWSCWESDSQSASTINLIEDKVVKIYVGDLDIFNEFGDPVDSNKLNIKREWISSDGWRGHYDTTIEGWDNVLTGWTTANWGGDPIGERKANFNEWADALLTGEIYSPCPVAIVADPTSNVFSTGIAVLVKKKDIKSFRSWLSDDYYNLDSSLR